LTVPSQADLKKREAKLQQFLKKLDADCAHMKRYEGDRLDVENTLNRLGI
jgi:hypothetical protein